MATRKRKAAIELYGNNDSKSNIERERRRYESARGDLAGGEFVDRYGSRGNRIKEWSLDDRGNVTGYPKKVAQSRTSKRGVDQANRRMGKVVGAAKKMSVDPTKYANTKKAKHPSHVPSMTEPYNVRKQTKKSVRGIAKRPK